MKREPILFVGILTGVAVAVSGCLSPKQHNPFNFENDSNFSHYQQFATQIEYPNTPAPSDDEMVQTLQPRSLRDISELQYWDLSLQEAIHLAMVNSKVLLDLGGTVLRAPDSLQTIYDVAVRETNPQYGVEAALSAFDAEFSTSLFSESNDRRFNNRFLGDGGFYQQNYDVFQTQITKRAATGSQFTIRQNTAFDDNNNIGNEFRNGAWDTYLEGEVRHPLLKGSGIEFNRIAGPGATPGVFNGVLVARIRTDISLADFQTGLRDFLSNVENAYWDLYFAYRDLETKIAARNTALETWRRVYALYRTGRRGGEAEKEAQARENYFRFEEEVQNALVGRPLEGTRTNNGSSAGTFRGLPGVCIAERKLRLLMGLPANDGRLIRPAEEPTLAPVSYDWYNIAGEALIRREELRKQRWQIKGRELELLASKNFLLPNLDFVGRYRWRGFGEKLIASDRANKAEFDNAFMNLTGGEFQEWQLGAEFSLPLGFRQGHSGVRNAEIRLVQARSLLKQQEHQVLSDLSNAVGEVDRAFVVLQTDINRMIAAKQQLDALQAAYDADKADFFVVLDAQRRHADAVSRYYQSRVEYVLAIRNVHFEKGSLLDYCDVALSEASWPQKAYGDAAERDRLRMRPISIDYSFRRPPVVALGPNAVPECPQENVDIDGRRGVPAGEAPSGMPQPVMPLPPVAPAAAIPEDQAVGAAAGTDERAPSR